MKLPMGAGCGPEQKEETGEETVLNPCFEKQFLTRREALNMINVVSGMLLIDDIRKR